MEEEDEDDYSSYEAENFMIHKNLFQAGGNSSSYKRGKMVAETEVKKRPSMAKLTQSRRSKED